MTKENEAPEVSTPEVSASHFDVVAAAAAVREEANTANNESYKQAKVQLDELEKEIDSERAAYSLRYDSLAATRDSVRRVYEATAKRIEREYRVTVYGEAEVVRQEKASDARRARDRY